MVLKSLSLLFIILLVAAGLMWFVFFVWRADTRENDADYQAFRKAERDAREAQEDLNDMIRREKR